MSQIRQSPDGWLVAIKRPGETFWRVSNGGHYRDQQVEGWTPLVPVVDLLGEATTIARRMIEQATTHLDRIGEGGPQ